MIKPIMTSMFFLRQPSDEAGEADMQVAYDLADTLEAHRVTCAGLAANMIGERKRIIAVMDEHDAVLVMFNPRIVHSSGQYSAEEGCLSLQGVREAVRYRKITVAYQDMGLRSCQRSFEGRVAQAIQHEIDHCNGILI